MQRKLIKKVRGKSSIRKKAGKVLSIKGKPRKGAASEKGKANNSIEVYLRKNYCLRYNVVTGRLEYKEKGAEHYIDVTNRNEKSLLRELRKNNIPASAMWLNEIIDSDFSEDFNPFTNYFYSLPPWDGIDHIEALANTIVTTNDPFWRKTLKIWLVAAVGCAINPSVTNHVCLILVGDQGIGKSTWFEKLIPTALLKYYFSGLLNPDNKDSLIQLTECLFIFIDEMDELSKNKSNSLKAFITKTNNRIRRPYGRRHENLPRRASFAGSVNEKEFLTDTTGNRRFLCFNTTSINLNHKVDMNKVYAQALHLYQNGFKHWFDLEEIKEINKMNEEFRSRTVEEELLLTYYEPVAKEDAKHFLSATALAGKLREKSDYPITKINIVALGKAARKHNFIQCKKGADRLQVWALKEKDLEIIDYETKFIPKEVVGG